MKIYTKIVMNLDGEVLHEESYEYAGPVAECKGGGSTSTTNSSPWVGQQPYLTDVMFRGQQQSYKPLQAFDWTKSVAGFMPEQTVAQNLTTQRAIAGSPLVDAAQRTNLDTVSGKYLDPSSNPWLRETYNMGARDMTQNFQTGVMPNLRASAAGAGAFGGSRHGVAEGMAMDSLAKNMRDLATQIYGGNYQTERDRQMAAVNAAPMLADQDYADLAKLSAVGQEKQDMAQALIDAERDAWEFEQMEPWKRLAMYNNLVSGDLGGQVMSSTSGGGK